MYVGRGRPAGVNGGGDESDPLALLEDDNARAIRVATSVEPMSANERSERCDVPVDDLPTHRPPYGSRTTRRTDGTRSGGPPPPGLRVSPRGGLRRLRRRRTPARTRPLAVLGLGLVEGHRNPARPKRECGRHSRRSGAGDEDACIPVAHVRTHRDGADDRRLRERWGRARRAGHAPDSALRVDGASDFRFGAVADEDHDRPSHAPFGPYPRGEAPVRKAVYLPFQTIQTRGSESGRDVVAGVDRGAPSGWLSTASSTCHFNRVRPAFACRRRPRPGPELT